MMDGSSAHGPPPSLPSYPPIPPHSSEQLSPPQPAISMHSEVATMPQYIPHPLSTPPGTTTRHRMPPTGGSPSPLQATPFNSQAPHPTQSLYTAVKPRPAPLAAPSRDRSQSLAHSGVALRLQYLEQLCVSLQKEKRTLEEDFGRQRKKFMNHMMQKDAEHALTRQTLEKFSVEVQELSTQLLARDEEVKNIQMAAQLMESANREAFDADRVKYEEEISSLRRILEVQSQEQAAALRVERERWGREQEALQTELQSLRSSLVSGPKLSEHSPSDSLETSMKKAAADTKLLRSVVVPLEEEIDMLKMRLSEANERLKVYEGKQSESPVPLIDLDLSPPPVSEIPSPGRSRDLLTPSPTEGGKLLRMQLQHQLELEREARHDLEMHLEGQRVAMAGELDSLRRQLQEAQRALQIEQTAGVELKKTWELANQHFIVAQNQLRQKIYHLEHSLTEKRASSLPREGEREGEEKGGLSHSRRKSQSLECVESAGTTSLSVSTTDGTKAASWSNLHHTGVKGEWESEAERRAATLEAELLETHRKLAEAQEEVSRREEMCGNYEAQLQRVQSQMAEDMQERDRFIDRLRVEQEKYKAGILRERKLRQDLRRQLDETREEMKTRIETFQGTERSLTQALKSAKEKFTEAKHDAQREIARFTDERVRLFGEVEHAREEYDCLKVLQSQQMNEYRKKMAEAQQARSDVEKNLAVTLSRLSQAHTRLEEVEGEMGGRVASLKEQLAVEQGYKNQLETSYSAELHTAKREIADLWSVKQQLDAERTVKEEALASRAAIQEKSKLFIENQQRQLEQLSRAKESAEQQVRELQRQVSSLRSQLNHTEATQKDFVELSQSLQVRLAEMEEQHSDSSPS